MTDSRTALVTGATGYIGAALTPLLLDAGWTVRVLTRDPAGLAGHPWAGDVEVVVGAAEDPGVLAKAATGVDVAWFLIHSMNSDFDYAEHERAIAEQFGAACADADVARIVYLGGLGPTDDTSVHLRSRHVVGETLMASGVPVAALRAGMVVGAGSASYDLMRAAARLPVIVAPDWLDHLVQPIALADALHYLVAAADLDTDVSRWFDIGGPDVLSYRQLLAVYAEAAGLRRRPVVTVPVLMPRTAALWAGIVAPRPASLVRGLLESLQHDMVAHEHDLDTLVGAPPGGAATFRESVADAIAPSA